MSQDSRAGEETVLIMCHHDGLFLFFWAQGIIDDEGDSTNPGLVAQTR
jgi:hypothetical protein